MHNDPVIEKGPGYVALVAIVVAREGSDRRLAAMRDELVPVELHADSVDDLAVKVGKYGLSAITSIGDPGPDGCGVALDAAVAAGASLTDAALGLIIDRDAA